MLISRPQSKPWLLLTTLMLMMLALQLGAAQQCRTETQAQWRQARPADYPGVSGESRRRRSLLASRSRSLVLSRSYRALQTAIQPDREQLQILRQGATDLGHWAGGQLALWDTRPSLWPCQGEFSSPFGYRTHPVLGYTRFHPGCDICGEPGTPIRATAAGKILSADWLGGYGLAVKIDHGRGLTTLYGHCSAVNVKPGQLVHKGQLIASMGSTGMATGPHCHYEVHLHGKQIDPAPYLLSHALGHGIDMALRMRSSSAL